VLNGYTRKITGQVLEPEESLSKRWSLTRVWGCYDLTITVDGDPAFERQVAGHVETGADSISDPALGGLV
jgi:phospholipase C